MALSFKESAQQSATTAVEETPSVMTLSEDYGIAAYDGEEWTPDGKYLHYIDYSDNEISTVDDYKNIRVNDKQLNITQEINSQYIPFMMNRYYDGFDLSTTSIFIHFRNKNGDEDMASPINVYYSGDKIRFGWLIDERVTAIAGNVDFEIQCVGTNSKGFTYVWKTMPNGKLNIMESLAGNGIIEPDQSWTNAFIQQAMEYVGQAQQAAQDAASAVDQAYGLVDQAQQAANVAVETVNNAKQELEASVELAVSEKVTESLMNYYDRDEIDQKFEDFDISDQLVDIEKAHDELAKDVEGIHDAIDSLPETLQNDYYNKEATDNKFITKADFNVTMGNYNTSAEVQETYVSKTDLAENNYTKTEADELFATKDGLLTVSNRASGTQEELTAYKASNDKALEDAKTELSNALNEYAEVVDNDLISIHEAIDGLPETLQNDYYNKEASDEKFATKTTVTDLQTSVSAMQGDVNTNKSNITTIGTKVGELETSINGIDKSPRLSYEATYDEEFKFTLWEIEGDGDEAERSAKSQFVIQGGGGGGGTSSVLKIEYITKSPLVATVNDKVVIKYNFSGQDSSGDEVTEGQATWKVGNKVVATTIAVSGENEFELTDYIALGSQKVVLSITDDAGSLVTKSWTVQKIDVRLESSFNDVLTYPIGPVTFDYTPYGAISKVVHFKLDGEEIGTVTTAASGIPTGYNIPAQKHGAHLLEVWMTADVNNNPIESNHIFKDIIWYDSTSTIPVIGTVSQEFTARQYDTTNIQYTVYDPKTETPTVVLAIDGNVVSTRQMEGASDIWQFKASEPGTYTLTITCGETVKTLKATVTELDIEIEPVTAGLVFDFNPTGKTNSDADRVWTNGTYSMHPSDNFDWVTGGYQFDEAGDQYFCIKAGTSVEIDYQLFADDAKRNGKEMKLIFKTTNVRNPEAKFLTCVDNTTGDDHIGVEMFAHEAYIHASAGKLTLPYSENDIIEFEFNISKNTESISKVTGYEDGTSTMHMVYDDSHNFTQTTPKTIVLGSPDCDLHIYRMKVYNASLTDRGILNNFIADARTAEEMIDRYNRNQIYDENQMLDPYVLAEKCPWLRVYIVRAPYFTNNKSDKVPGTTIEQIYKNGDPVLDNWICYDCSHSGQGTSSNNYGAAGRNLDFILNKSQIDGVKPYFILGDGKTRAEKISLTRNSVPVAYLNFKANIASSENANNALLARRYNEFNPWKLPYVREEGYDTSMIKTTMEFHNAVVFIQETNTDVSTHREFADCDIHYYSLGNIGDSKKTDDTRLIDPSDRYEAIFELMDVELPLSDWPVDTMVDAMGYKVDEVTGEKIYTWAKDDNLGILYEKINGQYVLTSDEHVNLEKQYFIDALANEKFDEELTYGMRYIWEDGTDEENAEVFDHLKEKFIEMYKFVTTSSNEDFKAHFDDYFVRDSILYYYLFTHRYLMVDNRSKNFFLGYAKNGQLNEDGTPQRRFHLAFDYDNDTSLGINNYGKLAFRYGLEDTDVDEKGEEVFREMDSIFFNRIRTNFASELKALYATLESANAWHAESLINQFDEWQDQFPEELWRIDTERKYLRTYNESFINGKGDAQFLTNMAMGRRKYQRREFERNQERYMASKYQTSVASSDNAVIRATAPEGNLAVPKNYRLKLTPYSYMYLNVKYGTQAPIQMRVEPNKEYEIPYTGDSADIIDIWSCSQLTSLGNLAPTYPATVDTSKASKMKELNIGSDVVGYKNDSFTTLTLGANPLLEKLNVENVTGLTQSLNLAALTSLKELYAKGTNTAGVTFADGGLIEIAELPSISAMSMKNLIYLTTLDVVSFDKLTSLTVENCNTVDLMTILDSASNLNRVRIVGIDWNLPNTDLLERIYIMKGLDKTGYNIDQSVLSGKVHVPVIRQQQLRNFQTAWSDLEIVADTIIEQFAVTFVNADADATVLEVQYVDKGGNAIDPTTREENPLVPTLESTVSHNFAFAGWEGTLTGVFSDRTITATYTSSLREYTIKYVSKGTVMQESTGLYGDNIPYHGIAPTYTGEEAAYVYHLFNRWDKSGFIDGEKTVEAVFDRFEYTEGIFANKKLADMTPVEIYALTKLGYAMVEEVIKDGDAYSITVGNDIDYDDIESELIISEKMAFNGKNYYDSGIQLFDEDKDFVLAIDYEFGDENTLNKVLAQCFKSNGSNGFKLAMGDTGTSKLVWGTASTNLARANRREMVVIRHTKGSNNLVVYNSNLDSEEIITIELERNKETIGDGTLVFGSARADDGMYENNAIGNIYWSKVWYKDLGDEVCKELAMWTHEEIGFQACGFRRYYLSENESQRCSFSLLATNLLGRKKKWNNTSSNVGGFGQSAIRDSLNSRLYNAIPTQIRSLVKQCKVPASLGGKSMEVPTSDCYIYLPAAIELDVKMTDEPYVNEGTTISTILGAPERIRKYADGTPGVYWTRTPNSSYDIYVWQVKENGDMYGYTGSNAEAGILIGLSF